MAEKLKYDASTKRYTIGDNQLHAGYPVTIVQPHGQEFATTIEHDSDGWYLVDWPSRNLEGLLVKIE